MLSVLVVEDVETYIGRGLYLTRIISALLSAQHITP